MQKEDISKRVNLLFSSRRTTQLADIINHGLSIAELSRQTGIKKARLYRLFDIPTKEELDTIEAALDVMKIKAAQELAEDVAILNEVGNAAVMVEDYEIGGKTIGVVGLSKSLSPISHDNQ